MDDAKKGQSLRERLQRATATAELGARNIARQATLIERMARDGHNVEAAERLLAVFLDVQRLNAQTVEALQKELREAEG